MEKVASKRKVSILALGFVFALVLAGVITITGDSVLQDISAKCREVYRVVARGQASMLLSPSRNFHNSSAFNVTATAVLPRAVLEGTYQFNTTILFVIKVPANVSNYSMYEVGMLLWSPTLGSFGWGSYRDNTYGEFNISGTNFGGTGVGLWTVPVNMSPYDYPTLNIPQNKSWLAFTSQAETYPSFFLEGDLYMVDENGTAYHYFSVSDFFVLGNSTTFYRFRYPVGAWLGYGSSLFVGVVSLFLLVYVARKMQHRKNLERRREAHR